MAKRNIFEMLGLEFDPPDKEKKIRAAYDSWKKRLTAEQNTTVDPTRLSEIRAELSRLTICASVNARLNRSSNSVSRSCGST